MRSISWPDSSWLPSNRLLSDTLNADEMPSNVLTPAPSVDICCTNRFNRSSLGLGPGQWGKLDIHLHSKVPTRRHHHFSTRVFIYLLLNGSARRERIRRIVVGVGITRCTREAGTVTLSLLLRQSLLAQARKTSMLEFAQGLLEISSILGQFVL